jgi:hypothetical protein
VRTRANYHLTFSFDGYNNAENYLAAFDAIGHGINIAVVFDVKPGNPLPATWHNYRVIDGDTNDLRFLDPSPVIVGLRAKGRARKCTNGFVVPTAPQSAACRDQDLSTAGRLVQIGA